MTTKTLRGTVRRVFFCNPDGPWMAGVADREDGPEFRFSGRFAAGVGDVIELSGKWTVHPKFGHQFEAETGLVKMDESPDALAHLLASHADFKGLGPARARKVVEAALALSDDGDASSALVQYPNEISERTGVPVEIVTRAATVWAARRSHFDALARLTDQGWTSAQATKIVGALGENAPAMVAKDPYALIGRLARFGFRTVDGVARQMGVKSTDPGRLAAGVAFCLDRIAENGNTWTTMSGLLDEARQELRPDTLDGDAKITAMVNRMIEEGFIHLDRSPLGTELVADAKLVAIEAAVFRWFTHAMSWAPEIQVKFDGPRAQAAVEPLNKGQVEAVRGFASRRATIISGGAGVGKTYTMRAICEVAEESGMAVALCAPTGKAAKRLAMSTERTATTIHRLLEPQFDDETGGFKFTRHKGNPIEAALVVIDEISMVDVRLMKSLLDAVGDSTRVLLVGDHHQIPSVGPGAILRDLLHGRDRYPEAVNLLTEIVRQAGELARNTSALIDGVVVPRECPAWTRQRTERGHEEVTAAIAATLVEAVLTSPEPLEPFNRLLDPAWDIQVLAPMRKGALGTYALNTHLQKLRQRLLGNPPPPETEKDRAPRPMVGDRVIWTRNDYELELFNGTQAIVLALPKGGAMKIRTEDGREVMIPPAKRVDVEVAWAMTIHKAQGSEWPMVVLVASSAHFFMHDRNLFYTGASRASEALSIVGDDDGVRSFAKKTRSAERQTLGAFMVHGWMPTAPPVVSVSPRIDLEGETAATP